MTDENPMGIREKWKQELGQVFEKNYPAVYRAVWASLGSEQEVDDLLQSVFLRLLKGEPIREFQKNPRGYLYRAAMNEARNLRRSRKAQRLVHTPVELMNIAADAGRDPRLPAFRAAMAQMDPDDVALLYLRYVDGLTCGEIAKERGTSTGNVYIQVFRAKIQVKRLMGIQENERETKENELQSGNSGEFTQAVE
jgi:RNA polymerase sigma-70 factor, ECF subfamily